IAKTALLFGAGGVLVRDALPDIVGLARAGVPPQAMGGLIGSLTLKLGAWTIGLLALVSALDAAYQRHAFIRKLRMSRRDIQRESKENEGDPAIRQQRRQAHQEWSQRNHAEAARQAHVLVVNPTHIAIDYDRETCPAPTIGAKGEEHVARAMREAAEEAGVPIVRNVPLARDLLARGEVGEIVPPELFDILAEVILWARDVRREIEGRREGRQAGGSQGPLRAHPPGRHEATSASPRRRPPPGEDLTRYSEAPWNRSR
ncbi:MAG TPA: EscU/YscU/HrcU family type III secretion system export apparatus switch protein, partial [Burkholderiaceae bacterium]|nr:EscU/YscU/HrcU family type III secretion system export apparatus switch protein [Burkholderiaceae bacterium]